MIVDFGIGSTALRYISKYRTEGNKEKINSYIKTAIVQTCIVSILYLIIMSVLFIMISRIYSNTMTITQLSIAKGVFISIGINSIFNIVDNLLIGIISGHNDFIFINTNKIIKVIIKVFIIFVVFSYSDNVILIVIIDLILSFVFLIINIVYTQMKYDINLLKSKIEKSIFLESSIYSIYMVLTSIAIQLNGNLDNILIGSLINTETVAIYSIAILIYSMFQSISIAITGVILPTVTLIAEESKGNIEGITKFTISIGRIQFILLGSAVFGFLILGKRFLSLWLGSGFEIVYYLTCILIIPSLFELIINVLLSYLRATNNIGFRTITLFTSTIINFIITFMGLKYGNIYYAAVGTSFSLFIGSIVIMGFYYYKKFSINIVYIYKTIFTGILPGLVIASTIIYGFNLIIPNTILGFITLIFLFLLIFVGSLVLFGFNDMEKKKVYNFLRRKKYD